jgi:hypothetical protein
LREREAVVRNFATRKRMSSLLTSSHVVWYDPDDQIESRQAY